MLDAVVASTPSAALPAVTKITIDAANTILRGEGDLADLDPRAEPALIRIIEDKGEFADPNKYYALVDASFHRPSPPAQYVIFDGMSHYVRMCQIIPGSEPVMVRLSSGDRTKPHVDVPMLSLQIAGMMIVDIVDAVVDALTLV